MELCGNTRVELKEGESWKKKELERVERRREETIEKEIKWKI